MLQSSASMEMNGMYVHIYYFENKRMERFCPRIRRRRIFFKKAFTRFESPLESLRGRGGAGGGD